jgi:copper chaperone CopZ
VSVHGRAVENPVKSAPFLRIYLADLGAGVEDRKQEDGRRQQMLKGVYELMSATPAYLHALEGRLRIKIAELKGSTPTALDVERELRALDGISSVTANPRTGNVLILYDPGVTTHAEIIEALRARGYLREAIVQRAPTGATVGFARETLTHALVRSSVELALQRLITTLI